MTRLEIHDPDFFFFFFFILSIFFMFLSSDELSHPALLSLLHDPAASSQVAALVVLADSRVFLRDGEMMRLVWGRGRGTGGGGG